MEGAASGARVWRRGVVIMEAAASGGRVQRRGEVLDGQGHQASG